MPITTQTHEPELLNVLASLGYHVELAPHNQVAIKRDELTLFVGHEFLVWCWLNITNQFNHPTLFELREG